MAGTNMAVPPVEIEGSFKIVYTNLSKVELDSSSLVADLGSESHTASSSTTPPPPVMLNKATNTPATGLKREGFAESDSAEEPPAKKIPSPTPPEDGSSATELIPMSYAEMKRLILTIMRLSGEELGHLVKLILSREPSLKKETCDDGNLVEVDFHTLSQSTLWALKEFTTKCMEKRSDDVKPVPVNEAGIEAIVEYGDSSSTSTSSNSCSLTSDDDDTDSDSSTSSSSTAEQAFSCGSSDNDAYGV